MAASPRKGRLVLAIVGAGLLLVPWTLGAQSRAALRQAHRLMERLKLVDGRGSGLDADTVRGAVPLLVRDANDRLVGPVINATLPISVAYTFDGRTMILPVAPSGFPDNCPLLCYESHDCTGTPYRDAADAMLPFVSACNQIAYYPTGPVDTHSIGSCRTIPGPCGPPPDSSLTGTTVATSDLGTLGFQPPFRIEGP